MRELLGGAEENSVSWRGVNNLPSRQINDFLPVWPTNISLLATSLAAITPTAEGNGNFSIAPLSSLSEQVNLVMLFRHFSWGWSSYKQPFLSWLGSKKSRVYPLWKAEMIIDFSPPSDLNGRAKKVAHFSLTSLLGLLEIWENALGIHLKGSRIDTRTKV